MPGSGRTRIHGERCLFYINTEAIELEPRFYCAYLVREIHGAGGLLFAPPADWPGPGVVVLLRDDSNSK